MKNITKSTYEKIASRLNEELKAFDAENLTPRVEVLERGSDGLVLLLNEDLYDLAQFSEPELLEGIYKVGKFEFYLEPFDTMSLKVAY